MTAAVNSIEKTKVAELGGERYADYLQSTLELSAFATKGDRTSFKLKVAAVRALEDVGYTDLKVSDICARANVALGTFYVYFRDKNEIAVQVMIDFAQHLYQKVEQVGRYQSEFDAILNTNMYFILAYQANAGLMRCFVQMQSQLPEFQERWAPLHLRWIENLARSIAKRGNFKGKMSELSMQVALALEGMVFNHLHSYVLNQNPALNPGKANIDELALMLSTLWYRAVYGRDPAL